MKIEELLKPRYKVIADYPFSTFNVGEVLSDFDQFSMLSGTDFIKYPHLFKKLEWWEDRKPEDMPEYLRWNKDVFKVNKYVMKDGVYRAYCNNLKEVFEVYYTKPATKEEYEKSKINSSLNPS